MKRIPFLFLGCALLTSCGSDDSANQVVSQRFVHKYGFETSEEDWEAREQDGQVVSMLKNGVKVSQTFENGKLHGPTTYTFPHSSIIEKLLVYDQGALLKESLNDPAGMPIREEVYEFDNRTLITLWDDKGVPLSIEEYNDEMLVDGKYYTTEHELEASVENGQGERVKRDRTGLLISRDKIEEGIISSRTNYHPNGEIHTISHYHDYQLHGPQLKFTASGKPLMELTWDHGTLHGQKVIYRNGLKVAVIPYINGQKQGVEFHYDDLGNLTAEIQWRDDKKHGSTKLYTEELIDTEWFFKGQSVDAEKFKVLDNREKIITDFHEVR